MKAIATLMLLAVMVGCAAPEPQPLEFLTRAGCVQTKIMRVRLDAAIKAIGKPIPYTVVDLDTLPPTDERKAYPTPTILSGGVDLFGIAPPTQPDLEPT